MPRTIRAISNNMLGKDDSAHRRLRKFMGQAFARRNMREMREKIAVKATRQVKALEKGNSEKLCLSTTVSIFKKLFIMRILR